MDTLHTNLCEQKNINLRDFIESLAAQLLVVPSHYQVGRIWENHLLVSHNPSSQADAPWITNSLQRRNFTADLIAPPSPSCIISPSSNLPNCLLPDSSFLWTIVDQRLRWFILHPMPPWIPKVFLLLSQTPRKEYWCPDSNALTAPLSQ